MFSLSTKFLKKLDEFQLDKQMPELGLISLQKKHQYSYLVPLAESFYKNPAFKISKATSLNLAEEIDKSDNPVFAAVDPTWLDPILNVLEEVKVPGVFYDMGAFVGSVSIHCLRYSRDALDYTAFEPNPTNRSMLELNLELNNLTQKVRIESKACSDKHGVSTFSVWPGAAISGRLSDNPKEGTKTYPVETTTFESYLNENPIADKTPVILKIDTEGHEWNVLKGVGKYWQHTLCCIVEYWPSADLSYEKYLIDNFHVLQIRSTMFSELLPYKIMQSPEDLRRYGEESIRASHNVDILLIPSTGGHELCSVLLDKLT